MTALTASENWERHRTLIKSACILGILLSTALLAYVCLPLQHKLGRADITHRFSGQEQTAQSIAAIAFKEKACMIVTAYYADTALLSYYLRGQYRVMQINGAERYEGWDLPKLAECAGQTLIAFAPVQNLQAPSVFKSQLDNLALIANVNRTHRGAIAEVYNVWRAKAGANP
jgi:hypothetical protein